MKITFLKDHDLPKTRYSHTAYKAGHVADVTPAIARQLVDRGVAEAFEPTLVLVAPDADED